MKLDTERGVSLFKALGDDSRLRIVLALLRRELCVCQIVGLLDLAPSTISRHLQILKDAGLIRGNKKGRWIYYQFNTRAIGEGIGPLLEPLLSTVAKSDQGRDDYSKLTGLLKIDPEVLRERMTA
ncbi:metalloregulator ArsR/SmtB family transcription factor [candidate division GN15 bacterium]|nr:metalloregulator ArsR/SmtB family transcription factor [candidate division GN15 bacterium]